MGKSQEVRLDPRIQDVAIPVMESLDTARALTVVIMLRWREYRQLSELKVVPEDYDSTVRYAKDCAATDFLRKYQGLPTGIDLEGAAIESFFQSERVCSRTNVRLRDFSENCAVIHDSNLPQIHFVVDAMRQFCREVLGSLPCDVELRFGPGATVSDGSRLATVPDKLSSVPTMTSGFTCMLPVWEHTAWARAHYRRQHANLSTPPQTVRGNVFFTVPKDSTKHRGAAKGPSLNVSYQLSVGRLVRDRLAGIGIDLEIGQELHQKLARKGSIDESLATIDLSSASDTVAYQLVKLVIPSLWFELFETLREPMTQVKGKWVLLNKYSAMGNGYTFELETLLFLSICYAAARLHGECGIFLIDNEEMSVYGDDIIVPQRISATVVSLLRFFGFSCNTRKTFLQGNFRESCGGDYFLGHEVTPFRLTDEITEPHQWIGLANGLDRLAERLSRIAGCSVDFRGARARVLSNLPVHIRQLTGPRWLGDLVIHENDGESWRRRLRQHPQDPNLLDLTVWAPVRKLVKWEHFTADVVLASALYGCETAGVSPRGVSGYKQKRVGRPGFAWVDSLLLVSPLVRQIECVTGVAPLKK
jgi:hypothetical protein